MKSIRIHYLQHVSFEGLGCIEKWALDKGHRLTSTKFYESAQLPQLTEFDWLIVMGGPMGVADELKYEWLAGEKEFIGNAIHSGKIVIGICLGAQLIASALGAKVFANGEKEIGWFPVAFSGNSKIASLISENELDFHVFHWHGDTFDLPKDSIRLASSEACLNQAFLYRGKVLALQFHFEVTQNSLQEMISFCGSELQPGRFVQSEKEIFTGTHLIAENNKRMIRLLDFLEVNNTF